MVVVLENAVNVREDGSVFYFNPQCPECDRTVPGNHYFYIPDSQRTQQCNTTCHCGTTYRSVFCRGEDAEMYRRYGY